jgi:hypothetical protein
MNNNDEIMMELLMQDEADASAHQEHRMIVLIAILLYRHQLTAVPRRGCSRV